MRSRSGVALAFAFLLAIEMRGLQAQTPPPNPDGNPAANTGGLKSQIETAGSYDPHSGNATRSVVDLRVPGALGVYGLDFTRYWNSLRDDRNRGNQVPHFEPDPRPNQSTDFGSPGWSHSWSWRADYEDYSEEVELQDSYPYPPYTIVTMAITITFPDGHASKYKVKRIVQAGGNVQPGPPYRSSEANWTASGQIHDHLERMASNGSEFWLSRADGGSVHFVEGAVGYQATEVFDPHGLRTNLYYDANGHLYRVEQEGGRRLNIIWTGGVISRVENAASPLHQAVVYEYSSLSGWPTLNFVRYQSDPLPGQTTTANYTYQSYVAPTGFFYAGPLLATADDRRFDGPMRFIRYTYRGTGCKPEGQPEPAYPNGQFDYFYASPTAIAEEKNGATGTMVSRFTLGCFDGTRSESNGLGGFRKFFFGRSAGGPDTYSILGYQLAKLTDFTHINPLPANLPFEWQNWHNGHPRQVWDGRGIQTELVHTDGSGSPNEVQHVGSDGSVYKYDRVNSGESEARDPLRIPNAHNRWLFSKTDERNQKTTYTRDARRRVKRIDHPDGSYETFVYNGFNQVTSHRLTSAATVTYIYDARGLLLQESNSVDGAANATNYTYYTSTDHPEWKDLVATAQNGRARADGKPYSTMMKYNGRGQTTEIHYPSTGVNLDPFVKYEYDENGNCTAITNEEGHRSTYSYDDYGRCTSYTEPLNAPDWNGGPNVPSRTWHWTYDRVGPDNASISASAHTSKEWRLQIEPPYDAAGNRRAKVRHYDYNGLLVFEYDSAIQAPNNGAWTYPADAALHSYTYDENGQKETYTDPLGRVTSYTYDNRNRLFQTIEPLNRTTATLYDVTGNKTKVTFPDLKTQQWLNYDPFGQAGQFIDERGNITNLGYQWGPMKKLDTVRTYRAKDNNAGTETQLTDFDYDGLGRKVWTIFPDGSTELNSYVYGQVDAFKNRDDKTKRIHYDARGREDYHTWDGDVAPRVDRIWDNANRLSRIWNKFSTIDYTHDEAGQVITETNTITGASAGPRDTTYWRYPNGLPAHVIYPNGWRGRRDYYYRGQLFMTGSANASGWTAKRGTYFYFVDGKIEHQNTLNGVRTAWTYDGRGQMRTTHTYRISPVERYSYRTYDRDPRDRISAWSKSNSPTYNLLENGRGDRYGYDAEGQLTVASYEALTPSGTPTGALRTESFVYDALGNRQGSNVVAGRGAVTFYRRDNGLNQYSSWTPSIIYYDDNYPGWSWPGNGVMMAEGWITAKYNALNQPIWITSPVSGGKMWFGFDPLGRCVKRWVSDSGAATTNPATYLYYDGWNLIQEGTGAAAAERIYVPGHRVDEIVCHYNYAAAQWRYHHYDARGHCILLTDATGELIEQYEYDAFGRPYFYSAANGWTTDTGSSAFGNRFLFTGREWLSDLKLYDYRHRLYQPELGRFLQPDPQHFAAGDYNLYRYCHNDPVNHSDPSGLKFTISGGDKDWMRKTAADLRKNERDLDKAARNGVKGAAQALKDFRALKNDPNYEVKIIPAGQTRLGANNYNPNAKTIGYEAYKNNTATARDADGSVNRDASIGLGHELGHAIDDYFGRLSSGPANDPSRFPSRGEESAIEFENVIRAGRWPNDPGRQRPQF